MHMFISTIVTIMSFLYRDVKDGDLIRITVENKHINGQEIKFRVCNNNIQRRVFGVLTLIATLRRY